VVATRDAQVVAVRALDVTPSELFERNGTVWFAIGDRAAALETYQPSPPPPPPARRLVPAGDVEPERPPFDGPADLDPHGRYADRLAPERTSGMQLGLTITPVIGGGIALMGDAFVAWRAKRAFSARLVVDRIGHTFSADDAPEFGVVEGNLLLGYDHRYFELAMGVGTARARIDDFDRRLNGMALTIAASMRFGALDGLHVQGSTTIITGENDSETSKIAVHLQWPMMAGKWFFMRGAGSGPAGYAWGEIGMRILARGQRGRGSLFISPALGGGGMRNDLNFGSVYGFTMSIGIEYRP